MAARHGTVMTLVSANPCNAQVLPSAHSGQAQVLPETPIEDRFGQLFRAMIATGLRQGDFWGIC